MISNLLKWYFKKYYLYHPPPTRGLWDMWGGGDKKATTFDKLSNDNYILYKKY